MKLIFKYDFLVHGGLICRTTELVKICDNSINEIMEVILNISPDGTNLIPTESSPAISRFEVDNSNISYLVIDTDRIAGFLPVRLETKGWPKQLYGMISIRDIIIEAMAKRLLELEDSVYLDKSTATVDTVINAYTRMAEKIDSDDSRLRTLVKNMVNIDLEESLCNKCSRQTMCTKCKEHVVACDLYNNKEC